MELILIFGAFAAGVAWWLWGQQKDAEARRKRVAEEELAHLQERQELANTASLVMLPGDADAFRDQGQRLLREFDSLASFQDVERWDSAAGSLLDRIAAFGEESEGLGAKAEAALTKYDAETTDDPSQKRRVAQKTRQVAAEAKRQADSVESLCDELEERVELTPNSKEEQRTMLRELRAERKDLTFRKREAKAAATEVRRQARVASANAKGSVWFGHSQNRRLIAAERRDIRRAKERLVGPHESEAAAIDRQLLALDRRIAWVQRFGDEEDAA